MADFRYEYIKFKNKVHRVKNTNRLSGEWYDSKKSGRRWFHRVDGPSKIICLNVGTGFVKPSFIDKNGFVHRVGGPAKIEYYPEEDLEVWSWYKYGWIHNT